MKKVVSPNSGWVIAVAEACRFLPKTWLWPISCCIGMVLYMAKGGRRRAVLEGYRHLVKAANLPHDPHALTRQFFCQQFMLMTTQYVLQSSPRAVWEEMVTFEGIEGVHEAMTQNKGLMLATMHFGSNLLSLKYLEYQGYAISVVRPAFMKNIKSPRQRRMLFIHGPVVYVGETSGGLASPVREAVKRLKQGHVVGIAYDGDQGGNITQVPLFGRDLPIRIGALEIARLAKAPMVFALGTIKDKRLQVRYSEVVYFSDDEPGEETTKRFLDLSMRIFEERVREAPDCVWFTRPFSALLGLKGGKADADE